MIKDGFKMLKYAKGGLKPKAKIVFLSLDEKSICWGETKTKDVKQMSLKDVTTIILGRST